MNGERGVGARKGSAERRRKGKVERLRPLERGRSAWKGAAMRRGIHQGDRRLGYLGPTTPPARATAPIRRKPRPRKGVDRLAVITVTLIDESKVIGVNEEKWSLIAIINTNPQNAVLDCQCQTPTCVSRWGRISHGSAKTNDSLESPRLVGESKERISRSHGTTHSTSTSRRR